MKLDTTTTTKDVSLVHPSTSIVEVIDEPDKTINDGDETITEAINASATPKSLTAKHSVTESISSGKVSTSSRSYNYSNDFEDVSTKSNGTKLPTTTASFSLKDKRKNEEDSLTGKNNLICFMFFYNKNSIGLKG